MTEWHILEIQMPVGAFCAFSGSFRPVRYFAPFLGHANLIFAFLREHRLSPLYGKCYEFHNIRDACIAMDKGQVNGKIVVKL